MSRGKLLHSTIMAFSNILNELDKGGNLVLGGTHAMILHGLEVPREPNDVDIIIYKPTLAQLNLLKMLKDVVVEGSTNGVPDNPKVAKRSYKLVSNKCSMHVLDILLEFDKVPEGLLTYKHKSIKIKVQSIRNILYAKANYGRSKDFKDFNLLKNINFNL